MPILALMGSMASVCLGNSFAKTLFPVLGAAGTVTYRVTIGAAILLAFWRPWRLHLTRADAGRIAMYGVTLASMNLLFYLSLQRLPIGIAIAIEFTGPLVLAVEAPSTRVSIMPAAVATTAALLLPQRMTPRTRSSQFLPPEQALAAARSAAPAVIVSGTASGS